MKRIQTIIVLTTLIAGTAGAAPVPAVEWTGPATNSGFAVCSTMGWKFRVSDDSDVWVSALGAYDPDQDGLSMSHDIAIWPAAGGAAVVTATLPAGTAADLQGHFRYVNIARIRLASGREYVIGDDGYNAGIGGDRLTAFEIPTNVLTNAPGISFLAARFSTEHGLTNHLLFPDLEFTSYLALGPNFLVSPAPPELSIRTSQVELCWETRTNKWYQLEYVSLLTTNQWVPFMTNWFAGDGNRFCTTDAILAAPVQRYYRLAVTNSPPPPPHEP
jgi:hypothetical protein